MPLYRDEAVVLRTHKLGEADRIVTMLSRQHGKIRAVAKGVRRTASKFGARLEPFMVADVQLYEGRSLDIITQAESLGSYGAEIAERLRLLHGGQRHGRDRRQDHRRQRIAAAVPAAGRRPALAVPPRAPPQPDPGLLPAARPVGRRMGAELRRLRRHRCARARTPRSWCSWAVWSATTVAPPGAPRLDSATLGLLAALLAGDWGAAEVERGRHPQPGQRRRRRVHAVPSGAQPPLAAARGPSRERESSDAA